MELAYERIDNNKCVKILETGQEIRFMEGVPSTLDQYIPLLPNNSLKIAWVQKEENNN